MYVVLCNCPPDQASLLARSVVTEQLAACVNAIPGVASTYLWEGELCEEVETTLLVKVAAASVDALCERLRQLHPYDTVELLALPVDVAHSDPRYVAWVRGTPLASG